MMENLQSIFRESLKCCGKVSIITFFTISLSIASGCHSDYTPKPRGYFKIQLPERGFQHFDNNACPFTFDYPRYGVINHDTAFLDTVPDNPCWFIITFPTLNGNLYLSYKNIDDQNSLSKLIEDSHRLTFKHTVKADFIDEN